MSELKVTNIDYKHSVVTFDTTQPSIPPSSRFKAEKFNRNDLGGWTDWTDWTDWDEAQHPWKNDIRELLKYIHGTKEIPHIIATRYAILLEEQIRKCADLKVIAKCSNQLNEVGGVCNDCLELYRMRIEYENNKNANHA